MAFSNSIYSFAIAIEFTNDFTTVEWTEDLKGAEISVIAVLISCFNRKDLTSDIVAKFAKYSEIFDIYVVDGGSSDGTPELLRQLCEQFPNLSLSLREDSYWAESMRIAWEIAYQNQDYDGYLLLNDDLKIENKRIIEFLDELKSFHNCEIQVGQCQDESTIQITYGGLSRKSSRSKLNFRIAGPEDKIVTFNGNFVFVPREVVSIIGLLSNNFRHSFADIDYGLRASNKNIPIRLIPTPVGITNYNEAWSNSLSNLSLQNWRFMLLDPKGIPLKEWLIFCYTHGGVVWPLNFIIRYLKLLHFGKKNIRTLLTRKIEN